MEKIFQISVLCIVSALLALLLKKGSPELGLLLSLAAMVAVFFLMIAPLKEIFELLEELALHSHVRSGLYIPLYKAMGIACVVRIGSCLCRDAGESALGTVIEMAGTVCTLLISIPLVRAVLSLLLELIE